MDQNLVDQNVMDQKLMDQSFSLKLKKYEI